MQGKITGPGSIFWEHFFIEIICTLICFYLVAHGNIGENVCTSNETNVLKTILEDTEVNCFSDISKRVKQISQAEKKLIPNVITVYKLLIINPATSCTPERSFSSARHFGNPVVAPSVVDL